MTALDEAVERVGRWTAARFTRRSLFGRAGKAAVLVAGGPVIATLLVDRAEARVCGQSGVSPKCPTYDCGDIWGWCWYSTGCCADNLLKKICDCCTVGWPNVHGYCPPGANVRCIVESCGADPRVQRVSISRLPADDVQGQLDAVWFLRFRDGSSTVVLAGLESVQGAAVALSVASVSNGPLLLVPRTELSDADFARIQRFRPSVVRIVDPWIPSSVDARLAAAGIAVERIGAAGDVETFSVEVASWIRPRTGFTRAVCVAAEGLSAQATPAAASLAAGKGYPLLVGIEAAKTVAADAAAGGREWTTYLVGPEVAARAGEVPTPFPLGATSLTLLAANVASITRAEGVSPDVVALAPRVASPLMLLALAGLRVPLLLHEPGAIDGARDWLFSNRSSLTRVILGGTAGSLTEPAHYELQSVVNAFEAHKLIGVGGQGLPVYSQPADERAIGQARPGNSPPPPRRR